jgi:ATP-binding cassette subfamily B (MDR/TAP) protein 1
MHLIFSRSLNKHVLCRAFIVSILAMISIGSQNYLFSASAASLCYKLRSLCLRAILRQDSKSVSNIITHTLISTSSVEFFDRDENGVRAVVLREMYMRELTVYLVWRHRGQVERRPTKDLWNGRGHPCSVRALRFPTWVHLHTLTIVLSIVQAIATLTVGLIVGLIYMWKVGLVGLGKYLLN